MNIDSKTKKTNEKTFKYLSFSAALCMFFSMIEYAIPKPLPFLRLGLANIPFILGLFKLKKREYFFLVLLKVIFQSLISGTFFSYIFVYSLLGSFASSFFMLFAKAYASFYITRRKVLPLACFLYPST